MINFLKKVYNLFFLFNSQSKFIKHNKTVFNNNSKKENIILLEQCESASNIIAYSYLASSLKEIQDAKIVSYFPRLPRTYLRQFMWWCKSNIGYYSTKIFKSFGTDYLLIPSLNKDLKKKSNSIYQDKLKEINNKFDLEQLSINDIVFGDLNMITT